MYKKVRIIRFWRTVNKNLFSNRQVKYIIFRQERDRGDGGTMFCIRVTLANGTILNGSMWVPDMVQPRHVPAGDNGSGGAGPGLINGDLD